MNSEKSNYIDMNKKDLENLTKSELIKLLLSRSEPIPAPRIKKPIPAPRTFKSVKNMVQQYEYNVIQTPPIPAPRTKKPLQAPIPAPRTKKPVPKKRTIISQVEKA